MKKVAGLMLVLMGLSGCQTLTPEEQAQQNEAYAQAGRALQQGGSQLSRQQQASQPAGGLCVVQDFGGGVRQVTCP